MRVYAPRGYIHQHSTRACVDPRSGRRNRTRARTTLQGGNTAHPGMGHTINYAAHSSDAVVIDLLLLAALVLVIALCIYGVSFVSRRAYACNPLHHRTVFAVLFPPGEPSPAHSEDANPALCLSPRFGAASKAIAPSWNMQSASSTTEGDKYMHLATHMDVSDFFKKM